MSWMVNTPSSPEPVERRFDCARAGRDEEVVVGLFVRLVASLDRHRPRFGVDVHDLRPRAQVDVPFLPELLGRHGDEVVQFVDRPLT